MEQMYLLRIYIEHALEVRLESQITRKEMQGIRIHNVM